MTEMTKETVVSFLLYFKITFYLIYVPEDVEVRG